MTRKVRALFIGDMLICCEAERMQCRQGEPGHGVSDAAGARLFLTSVHCEDPRCRIGLNKSDLEQWALVKISRVPRDDHIADMQSACSVDRIDSALRTVLPLVPGLSYFRFCCEDPRCGIELDEIDPEQWALLEVSSQAACHVKPMLQCLHTPGGLAAEFLATI